MQPESAAVAITVIATLAGYVLGYGWGWRRGWQEAGNLKDRIWRSALRGIAPDRQDEVENEVDLLIEYEIERNPQT